MKTKIKSTELKELKKFWNCYGFWYCEIQNLLTRETPIYYNCGLYWRNCDVYKFTDPEGCDLYIITWYRNRSCGKYRDPSYELCQKYENLSRKQITYWIDRKKIRENKIKLIYKMIQEYKKSFNS